MASVEWDGRSPVRARLGQPARAVFVTAVVQDDLSPGGEPVAGQTRQALVHIERIGRVSDEEAVLAAGSHVHEPDPGHTGRGGNLDPQLGLAEESQYPAGRLCNGWSEGHSVEEGPANRVFFNGCQWISAPTYTARPIPRSVAAERAPATAATRIQPPVPPRAGCTGSRHPRRSCRPRS